MKAHKTILLFCTLLLAASGLASAQTPVVFPDAALEAAVRQALGIPTGDIMPVDMLNLTELHAVRKGIANLMGLEYAANLRTLMLGGNSIVDVSPLAGLTALEQLFLENNQISNITPLSGLINLSTLILDGDQVSDISPVSQLANLTRIDLSRNPVTSIDPLLGRTGLTGLRLDSIPQVSDFSVLSVLANLQLLSLRNDGITSVTFIAGMTQLRNLDLLGNPISDISQLAGLTNLEGITLISTQISNNDILVLSQMSSLRGMMLSFNPQVSDFTPLSALTNIDRLILRGNHISNIEFISGMTLLHQLDISSNQVSDISALTALTNMDRLEIQNNQITDISVLANMYKLMYLWAQQNLIADIGPLTEMTQLRLLDLRANPLDGDACTTYIPEIIAKNPPGIQLQENTCAGPGGNLLVNGGFESGAMSPWTARTTPPVAIAAGVVHELTGAAVPEAPVEGSSCLHVVVSNTSASWWDAAVRPGSELFFQAGKKYTLSAFLKCKEGTLRIDFKPQMTGTPYTGYGEQQFTMTDEWAEYSLTTPVFVSNVVGQITFYVGFSPGEFWMDGVRFYEGDYVPVETELTSKAQQPSPAQGAVDVPTNVTLSWTPGMGATSHHIYFGPNRADVISRTGDTDKGTQTETGYTPGTLAYGTTHYWCVDEFDGTTTHPGNIWSFTTQGAGEGHILFEYFWGTDSLLETLLALPTFPDDPDQSEWRTSFEGPTDWREQYGTFVRGYLYPPVTGNYTFWIASDDQSQLWLSADENPTSAVQIASVSGWTPSRDFDDQFGGAGGPEQRSSPVPLEAGRRYYIEALHAEGWGGDNLAVAWQGPSIPIREVISGTFLSAWIEDSDGVPSSVEDGAPNGGDGNADGVPDSQQSNVASLPNVVDGQYVTLVSSEGTEVQNTTAMGNPSPADAPPGVEFPVGFFDFTLSGMGVGGSATVTIILPVGQTIGTYYKYGPTPDNPDNHWYEFLYDGTTGAEISSSQVILHLVDGLRGDDDLTANGLVTEPGGPSALLINHAPEATMTGPSSGFVVPVGTTVALAGMIVDQDSGDSHTAQWTITAEHWTGHLAINGIVAEDLVTGQATFVEAGIYSISLTVTDTAGASGMTDIVNDDLPAFVVVYDPEGGCVTGGGWIWSPTGPYPSMAIEGKASFGFVSKYHKGGTIPAGNTEFQFKAGDLNFHSTSYDWLVVTGSDYAKFKGTGTINGVGEYKFMIWAGDSAPDTFRIRIWAETATGGELVVYDNGFDQEIGGGSIVIHTE